jgi:hypothetical protein
MEYLLTDHYFTITFFGAVARANSVRIGQNLDFDEGI